MNRLIKTTMLVAGSLALVTQVAQAAPDDIILNFAASGVTSDYTINLGNAMTSVGVGGSSVVNLSALFSLSTFNSAFSTAANGVTMGAVGGGGVGVGGDIYVTQLRSVLQPDLDGDAVAGSHLSPGTTVGQASGSAIANGIPVVPPGNVGGLVLQANPQSWTAQAAGWQGAVAINPQSLITGSPMQEDLWRAVNQTDIVNGRPIIRGHWDYVGFLTLDFGTGSLTFTPEFVAVPEPGTYGVIAGAGLLLFALRRQLVRKQA